MAMSERRCLHCGMLRPVADFPLRYGKPGYYCDLCRESHRQAVKAKAMRIWYARKKREARHVP